MSSYLRVVLAAVLAALSGCAGQTENVARAAAQHDPPRARNVILMIADGAGYNHMAAADIYLYGKPWMQPYDRFPFTAAVTTFPAGGSYDPNQAWANFDYVKQGATDSAAAATAMATGVKTYNEAIGVGLDRKPLKNVVEYAEELGKSTGVVTTVPLSHATPAGFVAHNADRDRYEEIAREMISVSALDVIIGCGNPLFDNDGREAPNLDTDADKKADGHDYRYVGGETLWSSLVGGTAGATVDANHNGLADDAWTLIQTRAEFQALAKGPAPKRLIGIPRVYDNLQQHRGGDAKAAPYIVPRLAGVPTLEEMSRAALNVLDDNPNGFFLMIEGGAVDMAAHSRQSGRMVEEMIDFNNAVNAVIAWVEASPRPWETLVIVTADHETNYLTRAREKPDDIPWASHPMKSNGLNNLPSMEWNGKGHTNSLVPIMAQGDAARAFAACAAGVDPVRKGYIDDTDIGKVIFQTLK